MALQFNGVDQSCDSNPDLTTVGIVTLCFWINWDVNGSADDLAFEYTEIGTNYFATRGFVVDWDFSGITNTVAVGCGSAIGSASFCTFPKPTIGQWHQIVVCFDRANANGVSAVYVNGIPQTLLNGATEALEPTFGQGNPMFLFMMSRRNAALFGAGKLAEVAVFPGITLSREEAVALTYGVNPLELRTDVIPYYYPMDGDLNMATQERSGRLGLSNNGAVAVSEHPPVDLEIEDWYGSFVQVSAESGGPTSHLGSLLLDSTTDQKILTSVSQVASWLLSENSNLTLSSATNKNTTVRADSQSSFTDTALMSRGGSLRWSGNVNLNLFSNVGRSGRLRIDAISNLYNASAVSRRGQFQPSAQSDLRQSAGVIHQTSIFVPAASDLYMSVLASATELGNLDLSSITSLAFIAQKVTAASFGMTSISNLSTRAAVAKSTTLGPNAQSNLFTDALGSVSELGQIDWSGNSNLSMSARLNQVGRIALSENSNLSLIGVKQVLGAYIFEAADTSRISGLRSAGGIINLSSEGLLRSAGRLQSRGRVEIGGESYLIMDWDTGPTPEAPNFRKVITFILPFKKR